MHMAGPDDLSVIIAKAFTRVLAILGIRSSAGILPFHAFMCSVQPVVPKSMGGMCRIPFDVVLPVIFAISYSILEKPIKSGDHCSVPRSTRESYKASPLDVFSFGISMQMYVTGGRFVVWLKKRSKDMTSLRIVCGLLMLLPGKRIALGASWSTVWV
jgi:hypothetical protein